MHKEVEIKEKLGCKGKVRKEMSEEGAWKNSIEQDEIERNLKEVNWRQLNSHPL